MTRLITVFTGWTYFRSIVGAWLATIAILMLSACSGFIARSNSVSLISSIDEHQAERSYLDRAKRQAITSNHVTVSVAALRDEESMASFGLPLASHGIQPVWIEIENRSTIPYWFMPAFLDRDFYSAREAAYQFHSVSGTTNAAQVERTLTDRKVNVHIAPGNTVRGFVYTNLTRGIKLMNVELLGTGHVLRFDFAREQLNGGFDYQSIDINKIYPQSHIVQTALHSLGAELQRLPCCTTNAEASNQGDPLNLVMVGSEHDVLVALVRAGWDFTETITASSVSRMVSAFTFGASYRNSPISALHFDGRPQDFAMQRARANISQRNHLRLWLTPFQVNGSPIWIGQISRDIGVKITNHSPTLTTHVIDPDVDEARDYLLQDMLMTSNVARWGYSNGVGRVSQDQPRFNLMADPYFTDGRRLVLFVAKSQIAMQDAKFIQWNLDE